MVAKDYQKNKGSTKSEVGEIDTSVPFQSVKDAVCLFGESAFSGEKPSIKKTTKPHSADGVLAKETQLHLTQKELNKLSEQLQNAESMKSQALLELEKAKRTVRELTQKLNSITEYKDSAITASERAKYHTKQFAEINSEKNSKETTDFSNMDLETARVQYIAAATELDGAKQELRKIRQAYETSVEAKDISALVAAESENSVKANSGRFLELSEEISSVNDSIWEVKLASLQVKEEETKICAEKERQKQSYKSRLEETVKELRALKKKIDPNVVMNLESQLAETLSETETLRNDMKNAKMADFDSVKVVTSGLDGAKESLHRLAAEEMSIRSLVEKLKLDLDIVKNEHSELKEKEAETESVADNLHVKLRKAKSELEEALAEEAKVRGVSDEMIAIIHQLASDSEIAKQEAEKMKREAEELKIKAEATKIELEKAENKLKFAIQEVEEANSTEAKALDQVKILSEKTDASRTSISEHGAQITISKDEFESLSWKVGESEKLAQMKVVAALAQVEAVKGSENVAVKKLETTQKEIDEMKAETLEAIKKAEMAEAAKKAVEGELRKWHERELKKATEVASRIINETEKSFESSPSNYYIERQKLKEKVLETRKLEKAKTSVVKKVLMPSLSNVFNNKKNGVESGSPSYLPGERAVW